jgi:hypothetical protein
MAGTTTIDVDVSGLAPNTTYPDPDDPKAGLTADATGHAVGDGVAPWVARPEARSVFIHLPGEEPGGGGDGGGSGGHTGHLLSAAATDPHAAHVRIACADLF